MAVTTYPRTKAFDALPQTCIYFPAHILAAVTKKTRILDVVYNASNNELVRTKTLVKNSVVAVDCTPFRTWFETHYRAAIGAKLEGQPPAIVVSEEKKGSRSVQAKIAARQKTDMKIDPKVVEQFATGRVLAVLASRPGQSGRADGYILEGAELEFYQRKLVSGNANRLSTETQSMPACFTPSAHHPFLHPPTSFVLLAGAQEERQGQVNLRLEFMRRFTWFSLASRHVPQYCKFLPRWPAITVRVMIAIASRSGTRRFDWYLDIRMRMIPAQDSGRRYRYPIASSSQRAL